MALRTRGHATAASFVRRALDTSRAPHALLLTGPRGVGKTTLALDLAAGLLCLEEDVAARPCWSCRACRKVERASHPDLHRLAPEGAGEQVRIGQVQALASGLALLPLEGRARVAIIESAHRMNQDAQNALLKTLEEPGSATCIVLCADDPSALLPTLVSRAARQRLGRLPIDLVARMLTESTDLDPGRARALAVASGGRPGIGLTLARHPDAGLVRGRLARSLLDLLGASPRVCLSAASGLMSEGTQLDAALRDEPTPPARRLTPLERRRSLLVVIDTWRDVGRDLAVAVVGGRHPGSGVRNADLLEDLLEVACRTDARALTAFLERLDGLAVAVAAYASPELVLDSLLLSWPRISGPATAADRQMLPA